MHIWEDCFVTKSRNAHKLELLARSTIETSFKATAISENIALITVTASENIASKTISTIRSKAKSSSTSKTGVLKLTHAETTETVSIYTLTSASKSIASPNSSLQARISVESVIFRASTVVVVTYSTTSSPEYQAISSSPSKYRAISSKLSTHVTYIKPQIYLIM